MSPSVCTAENSKTRFQSSSMASFEPFLSAGGWQMTEDGWYIECLVRARCGENFIQFDIDLGELRTVQISYLKDQWVPASMSLHVNSLHPGNEASFFFDTEEEIGFPVAVKNAAFNLPKDTPLGAYRLTIQMQIVREWNKQTLLGILSC